MAIGVPYGSRSKRRCLIWTACIIFLWLLVPTHFGWTEYFRGPAVYSQISNRLGQPVCPTFKPYDRQKLLLLEPSECTPIESQHPDFNVDICFSPYVCNEGLVRIRRRDRALCKTAQLKSFISSNATHDAFHRQFSGPDSFYVVFSGAEKLAPPDWHHAGHCLYVFPFHISNPGKFTLDIVHLYDNFGAVQEQLDYWPELTNQKVVEAFPLEICRGCPSRIASSRSPSYKGVTTEESSLDTKDVGPEAYTDPRVHTTEPEESGETASQLPLCSRQLAVQGAWLPAHPEDKTSWRKANYTWTPLGKIAFHGDPQLRVLVEHLLRRLNGTMKIQTSTASSLDSLETTVESTSFRYLLDPLMTRHIASTDILVSNLGQWATGTKYLDQQMTTEHYHSMLLDLIDVFQQNIRDLEDLEDEDIEELMSEEGVDEVEEDAIYADELEDWQPHRIFDDMSPAEAEAPPPVTDDFGDSDDQAAGVTDDDEGSDEVDGSVIQNENASYSADDDVSGSADAPGDGGEKDESFDTFLVEEVEEEDPYRYKALPHRKDRHRQNDRPNDYTRYRNRPSGNDSALRKGRGRLIQQRVSKSAARFSAMEDNELGGPKDQNDHHAELKKPMKTDQIPDQTESSTSQPSKRKQQQRPHDTVSSSLESEKPSSGLSKGESVVTLSSSSVTSKNPQSSKRLNTSLTTPLPLLTDNQPVSSIQVDKRSLNDKYSDSKARGDQNAHNTVSDGLRLENPNTKLVWAGMVAYPETQPVDQLISHDWRSIYRLRYWNQIAEEVMMKNGIPFMDFFSMTLSMLDTSPDRSHYFGTDGE
ncbi:hypothetical protein BGW41_007818 [Actinomortierella wolfii]|nr:hypothetical protein BGW41_007818 [Actinomortierella wolfii]